MPTPATKVPRPSGLRSRRPAAALLGLLLGLAAAGCGDAESAQDETSARMIPPAEAAPAPGPAAAPLPADAAQAGDGDAAAEEADPVGGVEAGGLAEGGADAHARPRTVRRSDPPVDRTGPPAPPDPAEPSDAGPDRPIERAPAEEALRRTDPEPLPPPESLERGAEPVAPAPTVPAGTRVELVMETALSTASSREGDRFQARLLDDVLNGEGMVLLPRDAPVRGRVLESRESEGPDRPATLTLVLESVEVDGIPHPLRGTVEEVEMDAAVRDGAGETAAKVGVGAAAGAVLGRILGKDSKDALKGAAVGAAAGAAVALATRSGHATIPEGARLVIRLDEALVLAGGGAAEGRRP